MTNAEIIGSFYAAPPDTDPTTSPLTADTSWTEMAGSAYAGTHVGIDAIKAAVFDLIDADWEEFSVEIDEVIDGGDTVVGVGRYRGVHRETGRELDARTVHVWKLEDGKVVSFEQFCNTLALAQAEGRVGN